jgi:hypothetical protein
LQALLAKRDFAGIRNIGHNLKGTGTPYGFPRLTEIGRAMQDSSDAADTESLRDSIGDLEGVLQIAGVPVA